MSALTKPQLLRAADILEKSMRSDENWQTS